MARRIRKGDLVQVIAGADRGKQGRVISVDLAGRRVRVEKVRMQKRHLKPGRKGARAGGDGLGTGRGTSHRSRGVRRQRRHLWVRRHGRTGHPAAIHETTTQCQIHCEASRRLLWSSS